jgi:hypothetical protein
MDDTKQKLSFSNVPALNPSSLGGFLASSMKVAQDDVIKAELAPPESMAQLNFDQQQAVARGFLRGFVNKLDKTNPDTKEVLNILNGAIRSQDFATIESISPKLGSALSIYKQNPKAFNDYQSFSKEMLQGQMAVVESTSKLKEAEVQAATAQAARLFNSDTQNFASTVRNTAATISGLGSYTRDLNAQIAELRQAAVNEPDDVKREALTGRVEALESSLIDGSVSNLVRGFTPDDVGRLRQAFADGDYTNLKPEERTSFFIMQQSFQSPEARKKIDDQLAAYASGPAKFTEQKTVDAALNTLNADVTSQLTLFPTFTNSFQIGSSVSNLTGKINAIPGLPDGDRSSAIEAVNVGAARSSLALAMKSASSEADTLAINSYVRTGNRGNLPDSVIKSLEDFKQYATAVGDKGFVDSTLNSMTLQRDREIKAVIEQRQKQRAIADVAVGMGNAETDSGRAAASSFILNNLNSAVTAVGAAPLPDVPRDFFTNPTYIQDPNLAPVFNSLYSTSGAMPNELFVALESVADGNIRTQGGFDYKTVLAHYQRIRSISTASGSISNPSLNALSLEERGMLDFLVEVPRLLGSEDALIPMISSANQVRMQENFPKNVERFLGDVKLDDWMQESLGDSYGLLSAPQRESVKALTNFMIAQSMSTDGMSLTPKSLARRLNSQMDEWFPDGGGYVVELVDGMPSRRTKYALSQTVGENRSEFVTYVLDQVAQYAPEGLRAKSFSSDMPSIIFEDGSKIEPYLELIPRGQDALGGISYMVAEFDPGTGIRTTINRNDGQGPLMISTRERGFVSIVNDIQAQKMLSAERERNLYKALTEGTAPILRLYP